MGGDGIQVGGSWGHRTSTSRGAGHLKAAVWRLRHATRGHLHRPLDSEAKLCLQIVSDPKHQVPVPQSHQL